MAIDMSETINYYNQNAKEFYDRTIDTDMSFSQNQFLHYLSSGDHILDAGCGSGRDSRCFIEHGFNVTSIDASWEMCKYASIHTGHKVECLRFEDIIYENDFNGIWACASLLHIKKAELPSILEKFHHALKPNGIFYASFKFGTVEEQRLERFFSDYTETEIKNVFEKTELFHVLECFLSEDIREDYKNKPWVNIIAKKL